MILVAFPIFNNLNVQNIVVNLDGTHSPIIDNGGKKIIVNPDGMHSPIIDNGRKKIIVNPDGTHSVLYDNGGSEATLKPNKNQTAEKTAKPKAIVKSNTPSPTKKIG